MRRNKQPWWANLRLRNRFEHGAGQAYPGLTYTGNFRQPGFYVVTVDVPEYESRTLEIHVTPSSQWEPRHVTIFVDGPELSPHRYKPAKNSSDSRNSLCIWDPDDAIDRRWVWTDGLTALVTHARIHLYKEAHWRRYGVWLGEQVVHAAPKRR